MSRFMRIALIVIASLQVLLALAFFFQWTPVSGAWPYPGTTPMTFIFLASIFAAAAAPTLWAAISQQYGALVGIALDYITILVPVALLSFQLGSSLDDPKMTNYGMVCVFGVLFGIGLLVWSWRFPLETSRPMPRLVQVSFIVFILALLIVSSQLIFKVPNIIPWKITPELSVIIGWMFMGAAAYFAYGLLRPSWGNMVGQLAGFLAYDLVLIVPFLQRLPTTPPEFRTNLIIYLAVVIYSGLLAAYYLFVDRSTRILGR